DGSSVVTFEMRQTNKVEVIKQMVGREITDLFPRRRSNLGAPVLEIENLNVSHPHTGEQFLFDISFSLHAREVLGIGGLMGAGRTELLMHIFGVWGKRETWSVRHDGHDLRGCIPNKV